MTLNHATKIDSTELLIRTELQLHILWCVLCILSPSENNIYGWRGHNCWLHFYSIHVLYWTTIIIFSSVFCMSRSSPCPLWSVFVQQLLRPSFLGPHLLLGSNRAASVSTAASVQSKKCSCCHKASLKLSITSQGPVQFPFSLQSNSHINSIYVVFY